MYRRPSQILLFACLLLAAMSHAHLRAGPRAEDDDDRKAGADADLPTGMHITPAAARGAIFSALRPGLPAQSNLTVGYAVSTAISPDGNTLLILTSGYNIIYDPQGRAIPATSTEYVFVFDISSNPPRQVQVLQVARAFDGLAWNPNGNEFYVSGGEEDSLHIFARSTAGSPSRGTAPATAPGKALGTEIWREDTPPVSLKHRAGLGLAVRPEVSGLAVNASGTALIAANYENDSISIIDLKSRAPFAELDLRPGSPHASPGDASQAAASPAAASQKTVAGGEYPFWIAVQGDQKAYISSVRDREIVVVNLSGLSLNPAPASDSARATSPEVSPAPPKILARIPVRGSPNKLILNRAGTRLYVACDNSDSVAIIDTASDKLLTQFSVTAPKAVFANPRGFKGSNPNSLALSPDERTLYVTDGGTNALAVIRLDHDSGRIAGLIPTGWYPNSVSVSRDGTRLYIVNGKSPAGPNPGHCRSIPACRAQNQYILQLTRAGFLTLPVPRAAELASLTAQVARNDHFRAVGNRDALVTQFLHSRIHHIIYVIKENRTYDQVLGDLERGNGDPALAELPQALSPNHHQFARQFVTLDNFFASGDVSGDGWNWSTAARATDSLEKTVPIQYAGHGLDYTYEGGDRNINTGIASVAARREANPVTPADDRLLPGTANVSAPDPPTDAQGDDNDNDAGAGYLWDGALRAKLSVRNYGCFLDLVRYRLPARDPSFLAPVRDPRATNTRVAYPTRPELDPLTDAYYRGFDQALPDYWRFKEWEREFDGYVRDHNLPALEFVRLAHDHFGDFGRAIDGVNTVQTEMADNDYALGLLLEKIAASPYKDDTLVFVVEDDAQDGPDHVDAHRTVALVAGPYVRQHALVSERYTTVHMLRTIEDLLGIEPLGLDDSSVEPMTKIFENKLTPWTYTAMVPAALRSTQLPVSAAQPAAAAAPAAIGSANAGRDATYWESETRGMDFSAEDRLDVPRFNQILWTGLMGDATPYPAKRDARNLRRHRQRLLARIGAAIPR